MKQALTEARRQVEGEQIEYQPGYFVWQMEAEIRDDLLAAARLVERLLPGECDSETGVDGGPCDKCDGSGQVWDEGIVEAVNGAVEGAWDGWKMYPSYVPGQVTRAVLSALVELLTEKEEPPKDPWDYDP